MINEEVIEKTANLSRLNLNAEEKAKVVADMSKIIAHFTALESVNTDGVEPLHTPVDMENIWRPDEVFYYQDKAQILERSSDMQEGQIKVPQVVK